MGNSTLAICTLYKVCKTDALAPVSDAAWGRTKHKSCKYIEHRTFYGYKSGLKQRASTGDTGMLRKSQSRLPGTVDGNNTRKVQSKPTAQTANAITPSPRFVIVRRKTVGR